MKIEQSEIDAAVTWTLSRAARAIQHTMTEIIQSYGLSAVQFGVLVQLSSNGPMTRAELARATMVRPQSMAGVIEGMVEAGMLELSGAGGRGRANPLILTTKGSTIIDAVWPQFVEANAAENLGLTEQEATDLNAILHRLRTL